MRSRAMILAIAAMLAAPVAATAQEETADEEAAAGAAAEFGRALAAGDSTRALALLHPQVVIYEGGHAESLAQYRAGHLAGDMAFLQAVRLEPGPRDTLVIGDLALITSEFRARGRYRERDVDVRMAETMVLVRTPGGWRIRHIHWSSGR